MKQPEKYGTDKISCHKIDYSKVGSDEMSLSEKDKQKMFSFLLFLSTDECSNIGSAGEILTKKLESPDIQDVVRRKKLEFTKGDRDLMLSPGFCKVVNEFNAIRKKKERIENEKRDIEQKVAYALSRLNVQQLMDTKNVIIILKEQNKNNKDMIDAIESNYFWSMYQEICKEKIELAKKKSIKRVEDAVAGMWSHDFDKVDSEGRNDWLNSPAHIQVTKSEYKSERGATGTVGYARFCEEEFRKYIKTPEYGRQYEQIKQKTEMKEKELHQQCLQKIYNNLFELAENGNLENFKQYIGKKKLTFGINGKEKEMMEMVMMVTGISRVEDESDLRELDLFKYVEDKIDENKKLAGISPEINIEKNTKTNITDKNEAIFPDDINLDGNRLDRKKTEDYCDEKNEFHLNANGEIIIPVSGNSGEDKKDNIIFKIDLAEKELSSLKLDKNDEIIRNDFVLVSRLICCDDREKYDVHGKCEIEIMALTDEVKESKKEELDRATDAAFRLAKHYYLKLRRPDNRIPWRYRCILRMNSERCFDEKQYEEFWRRPESHLFDLNKKEQSSLVVAAERLMEVSGLDCNNLVEFMDSFRRDRLSMIGVRNNFLSYFSSKLMADLSKNNKNFSSFRLKSMVYLITACAINFFDKRAEKVMKNANYDEGLVNYYFSDNTGLKELIPRFLRRNVLRNDRQNEICEKWVDKIVMGKKKGMSDQEILESVFSQRMTSEDELGNEQKTIYYEAKNRARRQLVLNKKCCKKDTKKMNLGNMSGASYYQQMANWVADKIDYPDYQTQTDFEWRLVKEYSDAEIMDIIADLRVRGKEHDLRPVGGLSTRIKSFYEKMAKKWVIW